MSRSPYPVDPANPVRIPLLAPHVPSPQPPTPGRMSGLERFYGPISARITLYRSKNLTIGGVPLTIGTRRLCPVYLDSHT